MDLKFDDLTGVRSMPKSPDPISKFPLPSQTGVTRVAELLKERGPQGVLDLFAWYGFEGQHGEPVEGCQDLHELIDIAARAMLGPDAPKNEYDGYSYRRVS